LRECGTMASLRRLPLLAATLLIVYQDVSAKMVAKCPPEYKERLGTPDCVVFKLVKKTWGDADRYCHEHNGALLQILDDTMENWVMKQVSMLPINNGDYFWTDAYYNKSKNGWFWQSTGVAVTTVDIATPGVNSTSLWGAMEVSGGLNFKPKQDIEAHYFICLRNIDEPMVCDQENQWMLRVDSCFWTQGGKKQFSGAQTKCEEWDKTFLITVNNDEEQNFVHNTVKNQEDANWIGLTEKGHVGNYSWVSGEPLDYEKWADGSPKPMGGDGRVVALQNDIGTWEVRNKTEKHHFICERPKGACAEGFVEHGSSCYYFNDLETDRMSWKAAHETCKDAGTHLDIINGQGEDNFIRDNMGSETELWIGLYKNASSDSLYWVNGNKYNHSAYTSMSDADYQYVVTNKQYNFCVAFTLEAGDIIKWVPTACQGPKKYICEISAGTPVHLYKPDADQYCRDGWQLAAGSHCYNFFTYATLDIWAADEYCKDIGGRIASIANKEENDYIFRWALWNSWIGIHRNQTANNTWSWMDGSLFSYTNWAEGEPQTNNGNCAIIDYYEGTWKTSMCDPLNYFVCSAEPSRVPPSDPTLPPPTPNCGDGWEEDVFTGVCYAVVEERKTYADAAEHCRGLSYEDGQSSPTLVSLSQRQEQTFVSKIIYDSKIEDTTLYIGLANDPAFGFAWDDGDPITFLNFKNGEPQNATVKNCIKIFNDQVYQWGTADCTATKMFVCEKKGFNYKEPPNVPPPAPECPTDWVTFNNECYFVSGPNATLSNPDAQQKCTETDASALVSIMSEEENNFINQQIMDGDTNVWIGLYKSNSYDFLWIDGNDVRYTKWYQGEPSYYYGEDCVEMMRYMNEDEAYGQWNDIPCNNLNRYACKMNRNICPENYQILNGKCYRMFNEYEEYPDDAEQRCARYGEGGHLVSIHSKEEEAYVTEMMTSTDTSEIWVGLMKDYGENFTWTDDSKLDYINWAPDSEDVNTLDCATMKDSLLYARTCWTTFPYVCEYLPSHQEGCEDHDWTLYEGHCYYISSRSTTQEYWKMDYDSARERCQAFGGDLTSVTSYEEDQFLTFELNAAQKGTQYWIGLKTENFYQDNLQWSDGASMSYTNFGQFENKNAKRCFTNAKDTGWKGRDCANERFYACKKFSTIVPLKALDSGCLAKDDVYQGGSCYRRVPTKRTFHDAKQTCEGMMLPNSHLVVVGDEDEQAFLTANYDKYNQKVWIGLVQTREVDGTITYSWIDGSDLGYTNWATNQPDTSFSNGACAYAQYNDDTSHGVWVLGECSSSARQLPFICEYSREGYTTPAPITTAPPPPHCAPGWGQNLELHTCYRFFEDELVQGSAEVTCGMYGAHLLSLSSAEEEKYGLEQMNQVQTNATSIWTGLVLVDGSNSYRWTDRSGTGYIGWDVDQPNNDGGQKKCATASLATMKLSNAGCVETYPFVCEAPEGMTYTTVGPTTEPPPLQPCPDLEGWVVHRDHCYKVFSQTHETRKNWAGARSKCNQSEAFLASILDEQENNFIVNLVHANPDPKLWIGGKTVESNSKVIWDDSETFNYANWDVGQPNTQMSQSCVEVQPTLPRASWMNEDCSYPQGFICKKLMGNPPPPETTPAPVEGHCPAGWVDAGSKCVIIKSEQMKWRDGLEDCRKVKGGDLLSIHSHGMTEVITALSKDAKTDFFIGLIMEDLQFSWSDDSPADYFNWDVYNPTYEEKSNCVIVSHEDGGWKSAPCGKNTSYACQQSRDPSIATDTPAAMCGYPYEAYYSYGDACYRPHENHVTWDEADEWCRGEEAQLVSVDDPHELALIHLMARMMNVNGTWIGLNNLQDNKTYVWTDGYSPVVTNWAPDMPVPSADGGRCVGMNVTDPRGRWSSKECGNVNSFICKVYNGGEVPTFAPPSNGKCPENSATNWTDYGGSYCYTYELEAKLNWDDARLACIQNGAELVSIHSQKEHDSIANATKDYGNGIWSGLYRQGIFDAYGWSDGTPFNYVGWEGSQPSSPDFHCVKMQSGDRMWDDIDCRLNKLAYVCQVPKVGGSQDAETYPPLATREREPETTPGPAPTDTPATGMSGGAIFGVVVAVLVAVAAVGLVGYTYRNPMMAAASDLRTRFSKPVVTLDSPDGDEEMASPTSKA